MSPFVRGRIIAEVESSGLTKQRFDVLVWIARPSDGELKSFDSLEILRIYLSTLESRCGINLWVPSTLEEIRNSFNSIGISFHTVEPAIVTQEVETALGAAAPVELKTAVSTALGLDADALVVSNPDWFPYAPEIEDLNVRLLDSKLAERHCEIFVRGYEVPWSCNSPAWDRPWGGAYHFFEWRPTFFEGLRFLERASKHKLSRDSQEAGRSFVHNRIPNLCYTRDRLLFYDLQKSMAKRRQWERQEFNFEIAYLLNFYYLLIYGGFDHLAIILNGALNLGVPQKNVGASYESFLRPLSGAAPEIHALFTDPRFVEFRDRIGAARHYAAHRGAIAPGDIYEELDPKPTDAELDAIIAERGLDRYLGTIPAGAVRDSFRASLRAKVLLSLSKSVAKGVVFLEIAGKWFIIHPMEDVGWNFDRLHDFTEAVFKALNARFP
jgi:hypothetical protein